MVLVLFLLVLMSTGPSGPSFGADYPTREPACRSPRL